MKKVYCKQSHRTLGEYIGESEKAYFYKEEMTSKLRDILKEDSYTKGK